MNKPLTSHEVEANPEVIRDPNAYQKRRNRSGQGGGASKTYLDFPFAWRAIEMLDSPAYMVLSLTARRVMDALESEFSRHKGSPMKNGELICRYEDLCRRGIKDRHAIAPAIRELVALGFVRVTRKGAAGNADQRQATLYLLTYRHAGSNAIIEDGGRRIQTIAEAEQIAAAARLLNVRSKASEFGLKGAAVRWGKNKKPVMETTPTPVMETTPKRAKKAAVNIHFPVMETIPLSRVSRGRAFGEDYMAKLFVAYGQPVPPPPLASRFACEAC
jgi:hypothetical protein